jgi:hypothetical protein
MPAVGVPRRYGTRPASPGEYLESVRRNRIKPGNRMTPGLTEHIIFTAIQLEDFRSDRP